MYTNNTHVLSSSCVYTHPTQRYCLNVSAEATTAMSDVGPRPPTFPPPNIPAPPPPVPPSDVGPRPPTFPPPNIPAQPPPVPPRVWVGKIPAWNNNAADASHSGSPAGTPVTATAGRRPEQTSPSSGDLPRPTRGTPFGKRLAWYTQEVAAKRAYGIRLLEPAPFDETPQLNR